MAEERTTEEERLHILESRRRAAAKKKKLKNLGNKSSVETDEESEDPGALDSKRSFFLSA